MIEEIPKISDTEWVVMKIIWARSECTAADIINELAGNAKWKPKTIKSMISRLLKKKAIGFREDKDRAYIYFPLVTEENSVQAESQSFLDRVFGGEINMAVANFIEGKKMTGKEIDQLRKILDEKEK